MGEAHAAPRHVARRQPLSVREVVRCPTPRAEALMSGSGRPSPTVSHWVRGSGHVASLPRTLALAQGERGCS